MTFCRTIRPREAILSCEERKDTTMKSTASYSTRSGAKRVFSWITVFVLVFSLLAVPARAETAQSDALSAALVFSAEGVDLYGKVVLDVNQLLLAAVAGVEMNGITLTELGAYLSAQAAAVSGSMIGGAYGVDFTTLARNLPKSIFAPDSGSYYALDRETYLTIMATLYSGLNTVSKYEFGSFSGDLAYAFTVLWDAYSGMEPELLLCAKRRVSDGSLILNNKPIQVTEEKITFDGDAVAEMLDTLIAPLQDSAEAREALATVIDEINAASDKALGVTGEEAVEMIVSRLPGMLPELARELEDEGFSLSFCLCTSASSHMPVKYALELEAEGEVVALNLLMSEKKEFFRFEAMEDYDLLACAQLDITENTSSALVLQFTVQSEDDEPVLVNFNLNKAGQAFLVTVEADGERISISGYYNSAPNQFTITVDKVYGQDLGGVLSLILRSDDRISMPAFSEVTTMTESEFTALVDQISAAFSMFDQLLDT